MGGRTWARIMAANRWFGTTAALLIQKNSHLLPTRGMRPTVFAYSYAALEILQDAHDAGCRTVLGQIDPGPFEDEHVAAIEAHGMQLAILALGGVRPSTGDDGAMTAARCLYTCENRLPRPHSGVAVETANAGIPVIYTRDTGTADFVEEHGIGLGMSDESVDDLARALVELCDRRSELTSSARARAPSVQAAHSEAAFVRALWRLATPTGT